MVVSAMAVAAVEVHGSLLGSEPVRIPGVVARIRHPVPAALKLDHFGAVRVGATERAVHGESVRRERQNRRRAALSRTRFKAGLDQCMVVILAGGVPHAVVHDVVVDRIAVSRIRRGTFVRAEERNSVDRYARRSQQRQRAGLLGQLGTQGEPVVAFQRHQRIRRDRDEFVMRNRVAADDERVVLAFHLESRRGITLARSGKLADVQECVCWAAADGVNCQCWEQQEAKCQIPHRSRAADHSPKHIGLDPRQAKRARGRLRIPTPGFVDQTCS